MDDDDYDRIVDPDGPPPWIHLLPEQGRAWRANEILRGRNPDPFLEGQLRESGEWPPGAKKLRPSTPNPD
jgi:hypothetical protein